MVESGPGDGVGAGHRTSLANERTQLAWWRTGFTAIAVALGVGRVLPDLGKSSVDWPYTVLGVGFALYGVVLIAYGTHRARQFDLEQGIPRGSRGAGRALGALTVSGVLLGLATVALIVAN